MNLKHLTDNILVSETKRLVQKERDITSELLHYLKEIDRRKLYSDYGYPSMMAFALKELSYSESSANTRIQAARMLADLPELEEKINAGSLSLTALGKASGFFRKEKIKDTRKKKEVLKKLENKSTRECEKLLMELSPNPPAPKEGVKIVTAELHQVKVNISEETLSIVNDLKAMLGIGVINDQFMNKVCKEALDVLKKRKFKLAVKPRSGVSNGRYISNDLKREVAKRTNGTCSKCGCKFMLNYDHMMPYSLGGRSDSSNLRLLCFHCNQRERIKAKL